MKSTLEQIETKLSSKSIPADKNLQASYFSKLLESCQDLLNKIQKISKVLNFLFLKIKIIF